MKPSALQPYFATCPKKLECFLVDELKTLGATEVKEARSGATFQADIETAYRICLWSRIANRILLPLDEYPAPTPEALYEGIQNIPWEQHLKNTSTLAVDFQSQNSQITHSQYGALKVKDGIVDYFRDKTGTRPSVDTETPDIRINVYVLNDNAKISLDLSGDSLHKRGYRIEGGLAPLKENLAAALLMKSNWPDIAKSGGSLVDPMCGSGTLPIEAALIAADIAPGLLRSYFGFLGWLQHQPKIWEKLIAEAKQRKTNGIKKCPTIIGYDSHPKAIQSAHGNLERIGLSDCIQIKKQPISQLVPPTKSGLIIANPPYGERLGEERELQSLYKKLGEVFLSKFENWQAAVLTTNLELARNIAIRAKSKRSFYNGRLECTLLQFDINPERIMRSEQTPTIPTLAEPFANRLKKNARKLKSWLKKESISAYRLYDQDLPEFAVAIDIYEQWVHVQEYQAPKTVDAEKAEQRLRAVMKTLPLVLEIPAENIFLKTRRKQKGKAQYCREKYDRDMHEISEYGCQFLVNFTDYLDTGLFLDNRLTRKLVGEMAKDKRFLNLFAYTGCATVYAAVGGAKSTTTVDMSKHYIDWAQQNVNLNDNAPWTHKFIIADCLTWISQCKQQYDLIFLDPPTFSNSKKMDTTFDVQRDHVELIQKVSHLLAPKGILIFSNNCRTFKMDKENLANFLIENWSQKTLPPDFQRRANIHNCWKIEKK